MPDHNWLYVKPSSKTADTQRNPSSNAFPALNALSSDEVLELTHSDKQVTSPTVVTIAMGCAACLVLFAAAAYGWFLDCADVLRFHFVRVLGGIKERPTGDALKHAKITVDCLLAFSAVLGAILLLLNILIGVSA